jgi:hypothetical protein
MQRRENAVNSHITKESHTYKTDNSGQTCENIQLRRNTRDLQSTQETFRAHNRQHTYHTDNTQQTLDNNTAETKDDRY